MNVQVFGTYRDVPCAGCAWQEFIVCAARLSFGVVRELLGFPLGCRRFFVGVVGRTSDSRSSDLSSRAAPRCLFCAWVSDLRFKCLFSTFLSTSLDDFEALGANFTLLERSWSLLGRIWGGPGGGLGGLGAPFGGSGAVLGPSWPLSSPSSQFWLALGPLLAALGSLLVALGPLLAALGRSWVALGRS